MVKWLKSLFRGAGKLLKSVFTRRVMERVVAGVAVALVLAAFGIIKPF